ncbi:hypothetical protein VNO77_25348 [Canavalia gladiata]|uniref:Uncharacterized protein n=1 Tax=Canavalia gladiata TaxID=3824 RepID=A0AAN9LD46_CANGL
MCNGNEAFKIYSIQESDMMQNLVKMNIDYCHVVELPVGLSNVVFLKKLVITNSLKLSALFEAIGKLVDLEPLRLRLEDAQKEKLFRGISKVRDKSSSSL